MTKFDYNFHYVLGEPEVDAGFKLTPEDFFVEEKLGFEWSGEGEHVCVLLEKTGLNTNDVVRILSRHCHVAPRDISYAGLKDKRAITRQWFSLRAGIKRELDFAELGHPGIKILRLTRNKRKLKRGSHTGNSFRIRLKNLSDDPLNLEKRARLIQEKGVPNYFGFQRFGKNLDNVDQALRMFTTEFRVKDRFQRGIYLSAARAWLFNQLLSERIEKGNWNAYLAGDVIALAGTASTFVPAEWDDELEQRLSDFDIHPTGPLWGKGDLQTFGKSAEMETGLQNAYPELCDGLVSVGLKQERRALRLSPQNLQIYSEAGGDVVVEFGLGKGAYATSVLRELVNLVGDSLSEHKI